MAKTEFDFEMLKNLKKEGYTYDAIAEKMGCSRVTVWKYLKQLRDNDISASELPETPLAPVPPPHKNKKRQFNLVAGNLIAIDNDPRTLWRVERVYKSFFTAVSDNPPTRLRIPKDYFTHYRMPITIVAGEAECLIEHPEKIAENQIGNMPDEGLYQIDNKIAPRGDFGGRNGISDVDVILQIVGGIELTDDERRAVIEKATREKRAKALENALETLMERGNDIATD